MVRLSLRFGEGMRVTLDLDTPITPGCPFEYQEWTPESKRCRRCGEVLTGKSLKWCGRKQRAGRRSCYEIWAVNHEWNYARWEALRLARGPGASTGYVLVGGKPPKCVRCGTDKARMEVNHIGPRNGQGYGKGCWNHQTNLEVLCHDCHVKVTVDQRKARAHNGQGVLV